MNLKNLRIIVTGGAGFIGSHLVDKLLAMGNHVTIIDNLSSGKKEFINHEAEFVKGDLKDWKFCIKHIRNADVVFHLAANVDVKLGVKYPNIDFDTNVEGTDNVLEAMRINEVNHICFTSSSVVYGNAKKMPTKEDYGPLVPISLYGASKLADEALISGYCGTFGMQSWILRFANIIGPRQTHGIIFDFIKKLQNNPDELEVLGDGKQSKSYVYVLDCVDAMIAAVEKSNETVNIFNISSHDDTKAELIAKLVTAEMGLSSRAKIWCTGGNQGWKGDIPHMLLDSSALRKLGWKPKFNSKTSVEETTRVLMKELL
jgi:UDP-glucose 4-epimerase